MPATPLGVLDLVPISEDSDANEALRRSIDLAQHAERLGYARYGFAEHHLNPGVAGTSPAVLPALTAAATTTPRLGSGAVQPGHRTALSTVEEFGLIDALHPGRLDLGLGRSGGAPPQPAVTPRPGATLSPDAVQPLSVAPSQPPSAAPSPDGTQVTDGRAPNGLRIPEKSDFSALLTSPRLALQRALLHLPGARPRDYAERVDDILALLRGGYRSADGVEAHAVPGEGAHVQVWILGGSGGTSARVAGGNGLRFAANYHVSPATVLEAVAGYRAAVQPSDELAAPYVSVSADIVVGENDEQAHELAEGYGPWVRGIRTAAGAIRYPSPGQARSLPWSEEDAALVADRIETRLVGSPQRVADGLEQLQEATGADELLLTTLTHDHAARVRSYELLAKEWNSR